MVILLPILELFWVKKPFKYNLLSIIMPMQIKIDMRETDLIKLCREITDIPIEVVALELGDAIIGLPGENGDFEAIIIIELSLIHI